MSQNKPLLGCLGPEGTFSYKAANIWSNSQYRLEVFPSNTAVLKALQDNKVDQAIVAIENVRGGEVTETIDRLIEDAKNGSHLEITAELLLPIRHMLLGKNGTNLNGIKKVFSHQQAIVQCNLFISQYNFEVVETDSTAKAAEMVAKSDGLTFGAIASLEAAEKYKLQVLACDIGDRKDNMTRFIVLGGSSPLPTGSDKTTIFFTLKNKPGALYKVLEVFYHKKINLSKISSRPLNDDGKPWEYIFLVDVDGHRTEESLQSAIRILNKRSESYWILGSEPKANLPA